MEEFSSSIIDYFSWIKKLLSELFNYFDFAW